MPLSQRARGTGMISSVSGHLTIGTGLRGLADRIEALDGGLRIESFPGTGTRIEAQIPCE